VNVVTNPEEKPETSLPTPARIATQSAYTEAEAKDEVVAAARIVVRAFDDAEEMAEEDEEIGSHELAEAVAELNRALVLVDTYKGVK